MWFLFLVNQFYGWDPIIEILVNQKRNYNGDYRYRGILILKFSKGVAPSQEVLQSLGLHASSLGQDSKARREANTAGKDRQEISGVERETTSV